MKKELLSSTSKELEELRRENEYLKKEILLLNTLVRNLERGCACYINNKKFNV